jgi:hypothetical protein
MQDTSEKMEQLLRKWQSSGQSKMAFCKSEGISYATFNYRMKRFSKISDSGFSEVSLKGLSTPNCELIFPSGVRMIFGSTPSMSYLKELLF